MKKLEIAKALQENSKKYKQFFALYIEYFPILAKLTRVQDKKLTSFDICLDFTEKLELNMIDWELFAIQTHFEFLAHSYVFVNQKTKKIFDVTVYDDGRLIAPSYTFMQARFCMDIGKYNYLTLQFKDEYLENFSQK